MMMTENLPSLALLDQMPVGLTFADADGIIRYYNSFMAQHFQRSADMIGRHLFDYHNPDSVQKIKEMYTQFNNGRKAPYLTRGSRDGKSFLIAYQPVFQDGRFIGCLEVLQFPESLLAAPPTAGVYQSRSSTNKEDS